MENYKSEILEQIGQGQKMLAVTVQLCRKTGEVTFLILVGPFIRGTQLHRTLELWAIFSYPATCN